MGTERTTCGKCQRKCAGQVLAVGETYFHHYCFTCQECSRELGEDAFYNKDGTFYCSKDYLSIFGEHCFKCNQFLEGEVISALGNTFHLDCFSCGQCKKFFPPGENVIFDGRDYVCENCDSGMEPLPQVPLHQCSGCRKEIATGQALMALDQHWHPQCFTCQKCGVILHGEYMGKDGYAFCEKDYQSEFGVVCASCQGYITGKVLQAGDKHYHPQCSRCAKCGQMFGEGEEMYLQGSEIWHPQCSEMVREMERAEKERAERQQREAEEQAYQAEAQRRQEQIEREQKEREIQLEAERREAEQRKAEAERREMEQRQQFEQQARERAQKERELQMEAERKEAEQRKAEAERREMEQRQYENQRNYQIQSVGRTDGGQIDINLNGPLISNTDNLPPPNFSPPPAPSPPEELPAPPRPAEMPKDPPAPPTRTASRGAVDMARYGSLPRNGKPREAVPVRPRSYHEPSYNNYDDYTDNNNTSSTYKSSVQMKLNKSRDDSNIGTTTRTSYSSSPATSPAGPQKFYPYEELKKIVATGFSRFSGIKKEKLEAYLSDEDFQDIFRMTKEEFYRLPNWKQSDQKKKVFLF